MKPQILLFFLLIMGGCGGGVLNTRTGSVEEKLDGSDSAKDKSPEMTAENSIELALDLQTDFGADLGKLGKLSDLVYQIECLGTRKIKGSSLAREDITLSGAGKFRFPVGKTNCYMGPVSLKIGSESFTLTDGFEVYFQKGFSGVISANLISTTNDKRQIIAVVESSLPKTALAFGLAEVPKFSLRLYTPHSACEMLMICTELKTSCNAVALTLAVSFESSGQEGDGQSGNRIGGSIAVVSQPDAPSSDKGSVIDFSELKCPQGMEAGKTAITSCVYDLSFADDTPPCNCEDDEKKPDPMIKFEAKPLGDAFKYSRWDFPLGKNADGKGCSLEGDFLLCPSSLLTKAEATVRGVFGFNACIRKDDTCKFSDESSARWNIWSDDPAADACVVKIVDNVEKCVENIARKCEGNGNPETGSPSNDCSKNLSFKEAAPRTATCTPESAVNSCCVESSGDGFNCKLVEESPTPSPTPAPEICVHTDEQKMSDSPLAAHRLEVFIPPGRENLISNPSIDYTFKNPNNWADIHAENYSRCYNENPPQCTNTGSYQCLYSSEQPKLTHFASKMDASGVYHWYSGLSTQVFWVRASHNLRPGSPSLPILAVTSASGQANRLGASLGWSDNGYDLIILGEISYSSDEGNVMPIGAGSFTYNLAKGYTWVAGANMVHSEKINVFIHPPPVVALSIGTASGSPISASATSPINVAWKVDFKWSRAPVALWNDALNIVLRAAKWKDAAGTEQSINYCQSSWSPGPICFESVADTHIVLKGNGTSGTLDFSKVYEDPYSYYDIDNIPIPGIKAFTLKVGLP